MPRPGSNDPSNVSKRIALNEHATGVRPRIAVVGAGLIGRRHVAVVTADPRCDLSAIVDPDPRTGELAQGLGVRWYASLADLLHDDPPDGAIIATPNALHVSNVLECVSAGVAVLVEKPIATTVEDGERMAEAAVRHAIPLLVGHHRRHSPVAAAARRIVEAGKLGRIVAVSAMTLVAKPPEYFAEAAWRAEPGGGPILINLIHDIDFLRMLAGEIVSVQAMASNAIRAHAVEETVSVALRFADGALGSVLLSDAAAAPVSWEMTSGEAPIYPRYDGRDSYLVAGTLGTLGIPTMRLTVADGAPSWHRPMRQSTEAPEPADPLERQLEHFLLVIARRAMPLVGARDAIESLRVTLAVADAARTGGSVDCAPRDPASP